MNTSEKYRKALEEVLMNLRMIDSPNEADSYIDDSIKIIIGVLKDKNKPQYIEGVEFCTCPDEACYMFVDGTLIKLDQSQIEVIKSKEIEFSYIPF